MPVIELHNRYKKLVDLRSNWENHWQEIADYVLPKRADIIKQRTRGDKRTEQIYDGTALHALNLLSSSLHGMLTNAATPWFSLRYKDPNLATNLFCSLANCNLVIKYKLEKLKRVNPKADKT